MNTAQYIEKAKAKRLIFTVATGRCGTAYLSEIFKYVPRVESHHEPSPEYVEVLREIQKEPLLARQFLLEKKLPTICRSRSRVYVETSHLFCKGFLEPILELGITPDLVWLFRPHREVATSLYTMGTIPGRNAKALRFYLSPNDPGVLPLPEWQSLHDYQLCYWYCLEIHRRAVEYEQWYQDQDGRFVRTSLQEVTTPEGYLKMLHGLGLPRPSRFNMLRYSRNRKTRVNVSRETKKDVVLPDDLDQLEEEVESACAVDPFEKDPTPPRAAE